MVKWVSSNESSFSESLVFLKLRQVSGFLGGERDYGNLKGDTGPLVYPAGFLYVYSAVQNLTGGEVYPAQVLGNCLSFQSRLFF